MKVHIPYFFCLRQTHLSSPSTGRGFQVRIVIKETYRNITTASTRPGISLSRFYSSVIAPEGYAGVRPWKYREESTMSNVQVAPETKGVTVKLLATVALGPEIEGMAGRQLRMRMVTIEPGGVFGPIHDHKDRPGTVYILQGTITDHRNGVATDYGPGVGWPEGRNTK